MPYIPQVDRDNIDSLINACPKGWRSCYWLVKRVLWPQSYREHARCVAVFECAHMEHYRRTGWDAGFPETETDAGECSNEVALLVSTIDCLFPVPDGVLNYCCSLLAESPLDLVRAKEYMYANDVGPYEDKAIEKNGDLHIYAARSAAEG